MTNDVYQYFGGDVALTNIGDLMPVDGTIKGQQRIIRRLMTNPATTLPDGTQTAPDYLWHPDYGAGLPALIGSTTKPSEIEAIIRKQLLLEDAVAQSPEPQVSIQIIPNGITVNIAYNDAVSRTQQFLSFDVTK